MNLSCATCDVTYACVIENTNTFIKLKILLSVPFELFLAMQSIITWLKTFFLSKQMTRHLVLSGRAIQTRGQPVKNTAHSDTRNGKIAVLLFYLPTISLPGYACIHAIGYLDICGRSSVCVSFLQRQTCARDACARSDLIAITLSSSIAIYAF
jgi:hypothetical protein